MNTLKFNYNTHTNNYKTSMKEQEKKKMGRTWAWR